MHYTSVFEITVINPRQHFVMMCALPFMYQTIH